MNQRAQRIVKVPDIGEGIAEVELTAWHVKPGERIAEDQTLAEVMTDKASVEVPSPVAGTVIALGGEVGQTLAVGSELIRIEIGGDAAVAPPVEAKAVEPAAQARAPRAASPVAKTDVEAAKAPLAAEAPPAAAKAPPAAGAPPAAKASPPLPAKAAAAAPGAKAAPLPSTARPARIAAGETADRPIASPSVRRRAWELDIDLRDVQPNGSAGRIMHADLDAFIAARGTTPAERAPAARAPSPRQVERSDEEQVKVIGLRRRIAQKMQESKRRIPHFTYVEEFDVTEIEALRARLNERYVGQRPKLTLLPFLMRAVVLVLRDFPQLNARFDDEAGLVTRYGAVHLGIATQTENGLLVPVVRHAEARDLWDSAAEVTRLADAARAGRATRDELSGSTITITSLGALGGIVTTPVINHPEVAIVGVNRIVERPLLRGGAFVARQTMNLSSSFDHRVVDGADAARFVQAVRALVEAPALLFVE